MDSDENSLRPTLLLECDTATAGANDVAISHETRVLLHHLVAPLPQQNGAELRPSQHRHGSSDQDGRSSSDRNNNYDNSNKSGSNNNSNINSNINNKKQRWRERYSLDLEVFVQQFPKVELHVHLDGAFDPDVLWNYIQQHKPASLECLPTETLLPWEEEESRQRLPVRKLVSQCRSRKEYHDLCTCRRRRRRRSTTDDGCSHRSDNGPPQQSRERSLPQMLTCFEIFLPTVRQNMPLLEHLAYDFCQRQWQQNVVYTEVRYSPFLLAEGMTPTAKKGYVAQVTGEDVYLCITRGLRRGCHDFGPTLIINPILCCINWRPDWAEPTLALVQKYRNDFPCATVGMDVAAGEEHFDAVRHPTLFEPHDHVLRLAQQSHIPLTIHAGEVRQKTNLPQGDDATAAAANNIRRSVREYGATRIGHGYHIVSDPALMAEMKLAGIHFEVCPTSSVETGSWEYDSTSSSSPSGSHEAIHSSSGNPASSSASPAKDWTKHPCRIMQAHGLSVSLNSDDPAVFHTSLAWQYRTALVKMGMNPSDLFQSNMDAINAAFCSDDTKHAIRQQIQQFWQQAQSQFLNYHGNNNKCDCTKQPQESSFLEGTSKITFSSKADFNQKHVFGAHSMDDVMETGNAISDTTLLSSLGERSALQVYRRSVSENFRDRVYLETNVTAATRADGSLYDEVDDDDDDDNEENGGFVQRIVYFYT